MPTPIELPTPAPFNTYRFQLGYRQQISMANSGFVQTFDRAMPSWQAEYGSPALSEERSRGLESFLDQLEGSKFTFLAFDQRKAMPYAYRTFPTTSNPWGAAPAISSYNSEAGTAVLSGIPAGAIITTGDMFSVVVDGLWLLFRIQNTLLAGGGGVTVDIRPRLPFNIPNGTPIRYKRPVAEMKIIGGYEKSDNVEATGPSYSFKAYQYYNLAG